MMSGAGDAPGDVLSDEAASGELNTTRGMGLLTDSSSVAEFWDDEGRMSWAIIHHPDDTARDTVGHAKFLQVHVDDVYRRALRDEE